MDFLFLGERLAIDLLNTVIVRDGRVADLLSTSGDVAAWGAAAGVLRAGEFAPRERKSEPRELRAFREALRPGLVTWAKTGRPGPRLVSLLNDHLARDPEVATIDVTGDRVVARQRSIGAPRDRLYGAIARSAAELLARDDPQRLRKCGNPACILMFYDVSKAGRRRWCSMQTCGARAKVSAFRARRTRSPRRR